jgi:hypothetical protein
VLRQEEVQEAVWIQQQAYRLMRWVGDAVGRRVLPLEEAHAYSSEAAGALRWLAAYYERIPDDCRPAERSGPALERFARYFASYLDTSFELVEKPGMTARFYGNCRCWECCYLVVAPHLRAKRVTRTDKVYAERLKRGYLQGLAREHDLRLDATDLERLLGDPDVAERAALACYGVELLRRCNGELAGPEVLALWRQFAWLPTGSPKPGFELQAADVLEAEAALVEQLRAWRPRA